MRKIVVRAICALSVGAMILSCTVPSYATSIEEAEQKQREIEKNLADSKQILEELQVLKSDVSVYIEAMDKKLGELAASIAELQKKQTDKQVEIDTTQGQLQQLEQEIQEQYKAMKKRIQFMFENGNAYYMEMLFGTDTISDLLNKAEYISELEEYDRNMLNKMEETQTQIESAKQLLLQEQGELRELEMKTAAEQASVEALLADKQKELAGYESQIQNTEDLIIQQEQDLQAERELIEQMKEIERQRAAAAAAAAAAGRVPTNFISTGQVFMWPVDSHTISSTYGYRTDPINGATSYHSGVDIAAASGSSIYAVADGQVAWSYYSSTAGNWIGIDHGSDVYSVYMHCSVSLVSPGEIVKQGQVIALVGSTGRSTGPHLHLSIRANGEYVDPHAYVGY